MKKVIIHIFCLLAVLLPIGGRAQEYYILPELREEAKDGWHETYADKYNRCDDERDKGCILWESVQ